MAAITCDEIIGSVTNIGSGFEISIGDTAKSIADLMGVSLEIECDKQRLRPVDSEVDRLFSSYAKAEKKMKWAPQYGGLPGFRRGLEKTIEWFCLPENLAYYKTDQYVI